MSDASVRPAPATGFATRERIALVAIFVLAAALRFAFWSELRDTPLDRWQRFDQSDMATYVEQAHRIQQGDLLQPAPYHPYHSWQTVAPPEKWLAWYGPHSFHQAPAYSYALAAVEPFAGDDFALVKAAQLLLGAGTCVLIFLIARQIGGFAAGIAAGLFAALYGPAMFLEAQLLREGPALFWMLAVTYALMRHLAREETRRGKLVAACLALGAAVGAFAAFHELGSVLFLAVLIALALGHARRGVRAATLAVGCALIGWLIGFSPLLARNLAVGAPPFSVSCRTVINFVESNVADAQDGGATFAPPGPTVVRVLDEAHGSGLAALRGVWRTYDGDVGRALGNLWTKFTANGVPWEIPDNTSFEFFREHATTLRFAPTFRVLFPLGFAGLIAAAWLRMRRRAAPASREELRRAKRKGEATVAEQQVSETRRSGQPVLLVLFLGLCISLSLVHTVARFRMYLVPILVVYAGFGLALAWRAFQERRGQPVVALALCVAAGALLQAWIPTAAFEHGVRPVDFMVASKLAIERGENERVRAYCDRAREQFPRESMVPAMAGQEFEHAGQREFAVEFYRRALELDPNSAFARAALQRLRAN
ncbi:MAG TPA: tetratricopeptide repeat protein [Planctomycetota bacterium]|nr:tetratricopeptide repeat protein [Planctomycetota bacterium]